MNINEYLKQNQSVIYKILENISKTGNYSHAYLFNGAFGIPVFETAKFFAQTIYCTNKNPLACNECLNCKKILDGVFAPLIIIDGEQGTIKKEQVQQIEDLFSKTSIEMSQKYVYIINLVEHMTQDAVNALLKFLEEPQENIYALLTTKNISQVLPTIVSRCQVMRLNNIPKPSIITSAIKLGVEDKDAELLSFIYTNEEDILNESKNKDYVELSNYLVGYLDLLCSDTNNATFYLETYIIPLLKDKNDQRLFIDILTTFLTESVKYSSNTPYVLKSYENLLMAIYNKIANIEKVIFEIYTKRSEIDLNINYVLLFEEINKIIIEARLK